MTTVNHTVTINVSNVAHTSAVLLDSLYIRTSVANRGDTASFVIDDNGWLPRDWEPVTILVNATTVFGGYITSRQAAGVGSGSGKLGRWAIECRDWSAILDSVIVNTAYSDDADSAILSALFSTYLPSDGFDIVTNVVSINDDLDVAFENVTLRDALNQLAALSGAQWHISPTKALYWYSPTAPANAAFDIDSVTPNDSTTFDVLADSLRYGTDATTIINRCTVVGGEELGVKITDVFVADGTQDTFGPLSQKPGRGHLVTWTLPSDIVRYNGASTIGYRPAELGGVSEDGGYQVVFDLENRNVGIRLSNGWVPKAGTDVTIQYYALEPVEVVAEDAGSAGEYGHWFETTIYDEGLNTVALATAYAERVVAEYAWGRETVSFEVTEHGLLPGRLIAINIPTFDLATTYNTDAYLTEARDYLLLESGDNILLERYGEARKFLIQDVSIRAVPTAVAGQYMVVASVNAGAYIQSLVDSLASLNQFGGGSGRAPARGQPGVLSRVANDLGEVIAGRALFTDGGDSAFSWDDFGGHTGAVIGLDDTDGILEGAMYILQDGVVRAKVGKTDGLGSVGTIAPSGWGIWTDNGYFQGAIAANSGNIGGWTIAANAIYAAGGTISTSVPPINSSNPGVYMNSSGIFGYGTLGLTFSLPSDPAQRPVFSSGTILNTVYEVTTASVIRTGTTFPKVQIDNSGIFAYNSGAALKFSVDANTGIMTATDGVFSGSVTASRISGGTVTGNVISGNTVTGGTVSGAVVSGGTVTGAVFTGGTVTQGTISAATISGGTVTGSFFTAGSASFASGNVLLSSTGMTNIATGSFNSGDNTNIKWTQSGTPIAEVTGYYNAGGYLYLAAGKFNSILGQTKISTYGNTTGYSVLNAYPNTFAFTFEENPVLNITSSAITPFVSIVPQTTNAVDIGSTTRAIKHLYLSDGTDEWRVSINSSGVLVTTLV